MANYVKDLRIQILTTDTITSAIEAASATITDFRGNRRENDPPKDALLNIASKLRSSGGFLTGASSQEDFLRKRTTLLPSLRDDLITVTQSCYWSTRQMY